MKKKERRMILLLIIVGILMITVLANLRSKRNSEGNKSAGVKNRGEFVEVLEDGTLRNISEKLAEVKTVDYYEIANTKLTVQDGQTLIMADVKNIGTEKVDVKSIKITLLDKEGKEIKTVDGIIGNIEPGQTVPLSIAHKDDFANAYDYTLKIVE